VGKGGKKHLQRSIIAQHNAEKGKSPNKYINKDVAIDSWKVPEGISQDKANVFVSIRYVQHEFQCFSEWDKTEMKAFWAFLEKLHNYTWEVLKLSGGKSSKTGLAPTVISKDDMPGDFKNQLDPETTFIEFRVDEAKRVHGFRHESVFYICYLDKNHEIYP
jgi:hypothetical protein